jgi:hypothetical protein
VATAGAVLAAAEAPEAAASTVVRHPPERARVLPARARASVPETSETFGGIAIGFVTAISMMMLTSSSSEVSVLRSFIRSAGTILTGIIPTAIHLTDLILTATATGTDTGMTNPVTLRVRRADVLRLWKSSGV